MLTVTPDLPSHLESLHARDAAEAKLVELATTLDAWADESKTETGRLLLTICILRGGIFFFSDLLLHMSRSVEPGFCRAWGYLKDQNDTMADNLFIDWQSLDVAGRDVVLIDNICDSGRTLSEGSAWAKTQGARSVRTVVLMHRLRADSRHTPTQSAFTYAGTEWLVGYGMRDGDALMMNTRQICRIRASAPSLTE